MSGNQRTDADSSYRPPPLLPQICRSIPITGSVPCSNRVPPPQSSPSMSASSFASDRRSETPVASPAVLSSVPKPGLSQAPLLPRPTAYSGSNARAFAPPSSFPSVFQFAAPTWIVGFLPRAPSQHRTGSSSYLPSSFEREHRHKLTPEESHRPSQCSD